MISALPLEKVSTRTAPGKRRMREISLAHSYSGFTMTESPTASDRNWRWDRYSGSRMRAMMVRVPSRFAARAQSMFISSLSVSASSTSASSAPLSRRVSGFVALPRTQITSSSPEQRSMVWASRSMRVMSWPSRYQN